MNGWAHYLDEAFWVAVAFVLLIGLLYRPIARFVGKALDDRSHRIGQELDEAQRLREEAQATLAAYQKKYKEISEEAEEILNMAQQESQLLQEQAQQDLTTAVEARIALADEKIAQEEQKALQQVQKQVVEIAIEATKRTIVGHLEQEADETLITLAAGDMNRLVH